MTLTLRFDPRPEYPRERVWIEEPGYAPVAGLLSDDFQSADDAREFAERLRDVVAGKAAHFQGVGNGYLFAIFPTESEVGLNVGDDPETITVATADLIAALEEWAARLATLGL